MFEEYRTPPEWQSNNSELVALDFWSHERLSYSARIYWHVSQFYFEGRIRGGRSRHTYFPKPSWAIIAVGNKKACLDFLDIVLSIYGCPSEILSSLTNKVRKWKVANETEEDNDEGGVEINGKIMNDRKSIVSQESVPSGINRPSNALSQVLVYLKKWRDKCLGKR